MTLPGGWIADLFGYKDALNSLSALMPRRKAFRFIGAALSDNPTLGVTDVNLAPPFRGTFYVDPLSVTVEAGSEFSPFHTMAAGIAYALSQGLTSALFKLPPGAVLNESFSFPTTGTWEVETESTAASAQINGNITISNTGGSFYVFSRVTINGNIAGSSSGSATSLLLLRSAFLNGSITLTKTGSAFWLADFGGVGGDYNGNSGYVLNAVSVAGTIIAENFSFFGNLSYNVRGRFAFAVMNANVNISPAGVGTDTVMISCNMGGGTSVTGTGNPLFSVDSFTLASMLLQTASTVVSGVQLKTLASNASIDQTAAPTNVTATLVPTGVSGMFVARAIAHLVTSGGSGTLLFDIGYVDSTGHARTIALTSTGLVLNGSVATEDAGSTRAFFHDGSAPITFTQKGVVTAGSTVHSVVACRREN